MKYFVPILKSSIKENPNAGRYEQYLQGVVNSTLHKIFKIKEGWRYEEWILDFCEVDLSSNPPKIDIKGDQKLMHYLEHWEKPEFPKTPEGSRERRVSSFRFAQEDGVEIMLVTENNFIKISHMPESPYNFSHKNIKVSCDYCGEEFKSKELDSDSNEEGYSDEVCPRCRMWDCCELDYESLHDALKKKK